MAVFAATRPGFAAEPLVRLVSGLPWAGVSNIIGYDGRVWFVNSVKWVNHNSADVYAYDPADGTARFERHLFSQDAGDAVVHDGLLYFPFEDPRFSPGIGEFAVTDGASWRWGMIAGERAFHVHAMEGHKGALFAATSAWQARLMRSDDRGTHWRLAHLRAAPPQTVSRIVALAGLDGTLYAGLTARWDGAGGKLLAWDGRGLEPVEGFPAGVSAPRIRAHRGWLYVVNDTADGRRAVWRADGRRIERVGGLDRLWVRGLASDGTALYVITVERDGGALWRSENGVDFTRLRTFREAQPLDIAAIAGEVYVGTVSSGGGELWGPAAPSAAPPRSAKPTLPRGRPFSDKPPEILLSAIDVALAAGPEGNRLAAAALEAAKSDDPRVGQGLARRLAGPFAAGSVDRFGGNVRIPFGRWAMWHLLYAVARNGHGRVPPELLLGPWTQPANRPEKYLSPVEAAAWAVAELGQSDAATIDALIARLGRAGDPDWLAGDLAGSLSVLTGERHGYDVDAWKRWWRVERCRIDGPARPAAC